MTTYHRITSKRLGGPLTCRVGLAELRIDGKGRLVVRSVRRVIAQEVVHLSRNTMEIERLSTKALGEKKKEETHTHTKANGCSTDGKKKRKKIYRIFRPTGITLKCGSDFISPGSIMRNSAFETCTESATTTCPISTSDEPPSQGARHSTARYDLQA